MRGEWDIESPRNHFGGLHIVDYAASGMSIAPTIDRIGLADHSCISQLALPHGHAAEMATILINESTEKSGSQFSVKL